MAVQVRRASQGPREVGGTAAHRPAAATSQSLGPRVAWFAFPLFLWQALFSLVPLLYLLNISVWRLENFRPVPAVTLANYANVLGTGYYWAGYLASLQLSAATSLIVLVIAVPTAYALVCHLGERPKRVLVLLMLTPLLTSYVIRIYAWHVTLADNGIVNGVLMGLGLEPIRVLYTKTAITIGFLSYYLPVAVLILFVGISSIDRYVLEAARNLGCGPFRILWEVVIPNIRRALVFSFVFVFILTFGDIISPANLGGGRSYLLSSMILDRIRVNQWPEAAVMSAWMLATFLLLLAAAITVTRSRKIVS